MLTYKLANLFTEVPVHNNTSTLTAHAPQYQPGCENFPYASVRTAMKDMIVYY
ncbi:hypothetical protein L873DRAFT_1801914 [Choiromyces venosus 120613-1]|uniref:Uncharacterized protein n=1 Tax=Choiromyces venosus 120613-1 TaxID=1336337 RepID=A0A3N4JVX9_9PEZI|nr:hypothetical protein L873DRAFT_1801914 [Choiromyces venosus 120613-1]